jgi:hypothetical protein
VHLPRLLGQSRGAPGDLLQLLVGVLPGEALGHGLPREIPLRVAAVRAEIGDRRVRDGVDRRHDLEVVSRWGVHPHERHAAVGEPVEGALAAIVVDPVAVAQLHGEAVWAEDLHEPVQLLELMLPGRERGRELEQVGPEAAGVPERSGFLDQPLG